MEEFCMKMVFMALLGVLAVSGVFAGGKSELVNTRSTALNGISALNIRYKNAEIVLLGGDTETLVLNEYMTARNERYFSGFTAEGGTLNIGKNEGAGRKETRIELYLPRSYRGGLTIELEGGSIEARTDIVSRGAVSLLLSSGNIKVQGIQAETVGINIITGSLDAQNISGILDLHLATGEIKIAGINSREYTMKVTSGKLEAANITGRGTFELVTGSAALIFAELRDDISFDIATGQVAVSLPRVAAFNLDADITQKGQSRVSVIDSGVTFTVEEDTHTQQAFGLSPEHTLFVKASAGSMDITRL
jgi:hypothetical protein